jgi:UDP-glucose 4-epimerase
MKPALLVTGANGFVGQALCGEALKQQYSVITVTRKNFHIPGQLQNVVIESYQESLALSNGLSQVDVVIHLAARVHVMNESENDALAAYRRVNVQNTLELASTAVAAGVKRFIYLSSIKVNGEQTFPGKPFTADDVPLPQDPYGISKLDAEVALLELGKASGMEIVIIRPPLVYGPGVGANFAAMMRAVSSGIPLPLGAIENQRSMVAIENLVDLILLCTQHPLAPGKVFLVSDDQDVSLSNLLRKLIAMMKVRTLLIPIPVPTIRFMAQVLGKRNVAQRLCGSLQVDIQKTKDLLGWKPPFTLDQGLQKTVRQYQKK